MSAALAWGADALIGSSLLMALVLAIRTPVRRWIGPGLCYALWALPALRLILPPLPLGLSDALPAGNASAAILFAGPRGASDGAAAPGQPSVAAMLFAVWLAGAVGFFAVQAIRHATYCARLRREADDLGAIEAARIIGADVRGPLAFGLFHRFIAVPRGFLRDYGLAERDLVLAHEAAHHARGDLFANWASLAVLAVHWWNPLAWVAIRAFRDDQEFAVDAHVLTERGPAARAAYARVLAKAAGIGALPACNFNARSNLKGRLMMLGQNPARPAASCSVAVRSHCWAARPLPPPPPRPRPRAARRRSRSA